MTIAFLCPGQGSQHVGMGAEFAHDAATAPRFTAARDVLGADLLDAMFEGPMERLTETRYAQPALFLHSIVVADALRAAGVEPAAVAGHSLGEYSALVIAGVLRFEDGLRLVRRRAEAMQTACDAEPGTMAAVLGLDVPAVQAACEQGESAGIVDVANINANGQVVISGSEAGVAAAGEAAKAAGAKRVMALKVGGAFHSRLMRAAAEPLAAALDDTEFAAPNCTFIPNTTAEPASDPAMIREELKKQLTSPVNWLGTLECMARMGIDTTIEVGPGKVLTGMAKRTMPDVTLLAAATPDDIAAVASAVGAGA